MRLLVFGAGGLYEEAVEGEAVLGVAGPVLGEPLMSGQPQPPGPAPLLCLVATIAALATFYRGQQVFKTGLAMAYRLPAQNSNFEHFILYFLFLAASKIPNGCSEMKRH